MEKEIYIKVNNREEFDRLMAYYDQVGWKWWKGGNPNEEGYLSGFLYIWFHDSFYRADENYVNYANDKLYLIQDIQWAIGELKRMFPDKFIEKELNDDQKIRVWDKVVVVFQEHSNGIDIPVWTTMTVKSLGVLCLWCDMDWKSVSVYRESVEKIPNDTGLTPVQIWVDPVSSPDESRVKTTPFKLQDRQKKMLMVDDTILDSDPIYDVKPFNLDNMKVKIKPISTDDTENRFFGKVDEAIKENMKERYAKLEFAANVSVLNSWSNWWLPKIEPVMPYKVPINFGFDTFYDYILKPNTKKMSTLKQGVRGLYFAKKEKEIIKLVASIQDSLDAIKNDWIHIAFKDDIEKNIKYLDSAIEGKNKELVKKYVSNLEVYANILSEGIFKKYAEASKELSSLVTSTLKDLK